MRHFSGKLTCERAPHAPSTQLCIQSSLIARRPQGLSNTWRTAWPAVRPLPTTVFRLCTQVARADRQLEEDFEDEHEFADEDDEDEEDELVIPPLPTAALELLSQMLTDVGAGQAESEISALTSDSQARHGAIPPPYKRLRFCVNCCRPLPPAADAACSGCGHHASRDAEVLGDPHAWVQAYAEQLLQQQQQHDQSGPHAAGDPLGAISGRPSSTPEVLLAADPRALLHRTSLPPYPGRPERLQAIMSRLHTRGLMSRCRLLACRPAEDSELLAVHSRELVAAVRGLGASPCAGGDREGGSPTAGAAAEGVGGDRNGTAMGHSSLSADTLYNAHTCTAALLAAGAAADLGVALATGRVSRALAVVRPPGAQAGPNVARGGCYLNNVAVAASAALAAGLQRVLILDWDVHHGSGTQEIFAADPRVMVMSMHRYDSETYPGSGSVEDVGEGAGEGATLNIAFGRGGLQDGDLLSAMLHVVLPAAYQFRPQLVLVAAGFGALKGDPIGGCECSPALFAHLTQLLAGVAPRGVGLLLEGGYNLAATAEAVEGCLRVMLGEAPPPLPGPWGTTNPGWVGIMNTMQVHSQYWSSLFPLSFHGWTSAISSQQRQLEQQEAGPQQQQGARQQEGQQQGEGYSSHQSASFAGMSGEDGSWAEVDGEDDDRQGSGLGWRLGHDEEDDEDHEDEVLGGGGGGGGARQVEVGHEELDELAKWAAALRERQQAAGGIAGMGSGATGLGEDVLAYERDDPRDIPPAELLNVFLGSDGEEDGRVGKSAS